MPTALVTGASAGLGAGFARALAADGHDLILTARRRDRLEELAADLPSVKVHLFPADLSDPAAPAALMADIAAAGLVVDTLVNNAGYGLRGPVATLDAEAQLKMIDVNCRAVVALARAVLPGMIERNAGGILNVASIAGFQPGPWMAVYYASKAFVLSFSEALHEEVRGTNVRVATLCPGPTHTEFGAVSGLGDSRLFKSFATGPDPVIRDGMRALKRGRAVSIPGVRNWLAAESVRIGPRALVRRMSASLQKAREE